MISTPPTPGSNWQDTRACNSKETLTDKSFKIKQMNNLEMGDVFLPKVSSGEDAIIPESFDSSKDGTCLIDVDNIENDPNRHFSIVTESGTNRANRDRTKKALKTNVDLDALDEIIKPIELNTIERYRSARFKEYKGTKIIYSGNRGENEENNKKGKSKIKKKIQSNNIFNTEFEDLEEEKTRRM